MPNSEPARVSLPDAGATSLRALGVDHYHDEEWEATYDAGDNDAINEWLWEQKHLPGDPYLVRTLIRGPDVHAALVPISVDEGGDVEETELRFFESMDKALDAIATAIRALKSPRRAGVRAVSELRPCRACGAPCSVQTFSHPEKGIEATLWMCSAHRSLGGACTNEKAYFNADAWNDRPTPTQDTITARLEELLDAATPGPWQYRPDEYDDWGFIRGVETDFSFGRAKPIVAISREGAADSDHNKHRRDGTDPYEANGRLIVEAINALPALLSERATLKAELEEARGAFTKISGIVGDAFNGKLVTPLALDAIDDIAKALTKEPTNV